MCSQLLCFAVSLVVQLYYHFWRPEVSNIVGVLLQLGGPRANRFNGSFNCNEGDIYYHLLYYLFIYLFIFGSEKSRWMRLERRGEHERS
jgi:hypothetical protein